MKVILGILKFLETGGALLAGIAMLGCFGFGLILILLGFTTFGGGGGNPEARLVQHILSGLELLFLAPLPFLAFRSIIALIKAWVENGDSGSLKLQAMRTQALKDAKEEVGWVKRFIAGLMIAAVSTELIHRIFSSNTPDASHPIVLGNAPLDITTSVVTLGLIAVLSFYYWVSK
jgi:hypothetical protein